MMERATMATSFPKDQIKFLLLENVHQSAHELIRGEGFALETVSRSLKEDELAQKLRDVHVLGIRSKTQVTARALGEARRLLSVGCFCIGTNQRSEEHTSELQSPCNLVCRLLLEKKKTKASHTCNI